MIRKILWLLYEIKVYAVILLGHIIHKTRPMISYLKKTKKDQGLVGVEIGVLYGENAANMFKNLNLKRLYLIDIWMESNFDCFNKLHDAGIIAPPFDVCMKKLEPYKDKIVVIKKFSDKAVKDIHEKVDFVYIDGDHTYEWVKRDIKNFYPIVKKGGVLGGHDFVNYDVSYGSFMGVIRAVTEFCGKHSFVYGKNWWVERTDWWIQK